MNDCHNKPTENTVVLGNERDSGRIAKPLVKEKHRLFVSRIGGNTPEQRRISCILLSFGGSKGKNRFEVTFSCGTYLQDCTPYLTS